MEEVKRKLASIRRISEIRPIEGADNIEIAIVDGWQCVVKKGEFKSGDLIVYIEVDSFLPIRPEFEFLRKSSYKKMGDKEGFRIKTIKLRGQLSQGIIFHLSSLNDYSKDHPYYFVIRHLKNGVISLNDVCIGLDVTDNLGIVKYEIQDTSNKTMCFNGVKKRNFPSFIRKTDLERVQNIWNNIKDSKETFEVTTKLDGTSSTFYLKDGKFGVCSRNLELEDEDGFHFRFIKVKSLVLNILKSIFLFRFSRIKTHLSKFKLNGKNNVYWEMAKKYNIEALLRNIGENIALQGEIIGEGIQCNPEGIEGHQFFLFDIWDIDRQRYLSPDERSSFIFSKGIHLNHVIKDGYRDTIFQYKSIDELLAYAEADSVILIKDNKIREGLVFKSNESGLRFKVISNRYLLKRDN